MAFQEVSDLQAVRHMLHDRLMHIAISIENGRINNTQFELEGMITFLTELSYHQNIELVFDLVKQAYATFVNMDLPEQTSQKPSLVYNNRRGRPSYQIEEETLSYFLSHGFFISDMAKLLSVSERTIKYRMEDFGLSVRQTYSSLNDDEVDELVRKKISEFPSIGYRTMKSHLLSDGIRVTSTRIQSSMRRIDPVGVMLRNLFVQTYRIKRRSYSVSAPMALWHIDSNHKLIRWRFVFHGGIDGYSRLLMYLKVASDNTAETAFTAFQCGVQEFGLPYRVRTDKGRENIQIAHFMLQSRGVGKGSHITGRSVHNQRIERFWRELWQGCTHAYYELFQRMECQGILDVDSELHIVALHMVYLKRIQDSVDRFRSAVSRRGLRTEGGKTPMQLWIAGHIANPVTDVNEQDLDIYGVDFEGPVDISEEGNVVVPPLELIPTNINTEIQHIISREVDTPFETHTFSDVCSVLGMLRT